MPDGGVATVAVSGSPGGSVVTVDGGERRRASLGFPRRGHVELTLDGDVHEYALAPVYPGPASPERGIQLHGAPDGGAAERGIRETRYGDGGIPPSDAPLQLFLGSEGWSCRLDVLTREARLERVLAAIQQEEGSADPAVRSPMPGTVVSVAVADGDAVKLGQVLVSVEAMKMEHQLLAPLAGTVHLSTRPGDLVKAEQVVATIHPQPERTPSPGADTYPGGETPQEPTHGKGA
jgi:acetyl-CoA/propionyl-CoA carboxylase biotin carboxyl carrier protein